MNLISPLRDLFAAIFFLFFSFQVDPTDLFGVLGPAVLLAVVTAFTKLGTGWFAAGRVGAGQKGRLRAGGALIARGEFSIVIAALGAELADGPELGAFVAAYVLITAIVGPLVAKYADAIPIRRLRRTPAVTG
jgi:CPA2 family monovalent cation:H+ antiporter-2